TAKHPSGAVPTVRSRRQAHHDSPPPWIAESRNRTPPVLLVRKRGALVARNLLPPLHQPRAGSALHDLARQLGQPIRHSPNLESAAMRMLLIANAVASSVTARRRVVIRKALA